MKNIKGKIVSKTLAGILSSASVFTMAAAPIYATNISAGSNICESNKVSADTEAKESDILVDSRLKDFINLDKVGKYLNFDFKVPDYIGSDSAVSKIYVTKDQGVNYLELGFNIKANNGYNMRSLYEFAGDITENIKDITYGNDSDVSNVNVTTNGKKLGSVNGQFVTITGDLLDINNVAHKDINTYYVFTEDKVNYVVNIKDFNNEDNLSEEINKIASSLKAPGDVKSVKYEIERFNEQSYILDVYDKEDFNKAVEYLGYTPKFVPKINDDIKIESCNVYHNYFGGRNMKTFQCNYSYKNDGVVVFIQEKGNDSYNYEAVANNGYVLEKDRENNTTSKVNVDKLNLNNVNVYKYFDKGDNKYIYQWKVGDMYYFFETYFKGEKENVDDIVKAFVEA